MWTVHASTKGSGANKNAAHNEPRIYCPDETTSAAPTGFGHFVLRGGIYARGFVIGVVLSTAWAVAEIIGNRHSSATRASKTDRNGSPRGKQSKRSGLGPHRPTTDARCAAPVVAKTDGF